MSITNENNVAAPSSVADNSPNLSGLVSGAQSNVEIVNTLSTSKSLKAPSYDGATHIANRESRMFTSYDNNIIPIGKLSEGEQVVAIELDLGENFQYGSFRRENGDLFFGLEEEFDILDVQFKRIFPTKKQVEIEYDIVLDLETVEMGIPFYFEGDICIKIDTGMFSEEEIMSRIQDFKFLCTKAILDYYGKYLENESEEIQNMIESIGFVYLREILVPVRKGSSLQIVMAVKIRYLNTIPNKTINTISNMYDYITSTNFKVSQLMSTFDELSYVLKSYHKKIEAFSGYVEGINLNKLSERCYGFLGDLKVMLKRNGYILENLSPEAVLEFGFNSQTFRLEYVLLFQSAGKFLNIGINVLSDKTDVKLSKSILNCKKIINSKSSEMNWQSFLNDYYGGDFKINLTKPDVDLSMITPIGELQKEIEKYKNQYDIPYKIPKEAVELTSIVNSSEFKKLSSELLMKARDEIGDNFLLNLSEIIANIEDLDSLYELVFDKISVEEITNLILKKAAEELGLQDINEIKTRALMKKMELEASIDMLYDNLTEENLKAILEDVCRNYDFGASDVETFLEGFETNFYNHILHYDDDGNLTGMLTDAITADGMEFVKEKLDELGYTDCISLALNLKYRDIFEKESARQIVCNLIFGNIPKFHNPCKELAADIKELLMFDFNFQRNRNETKDALKKMDREKMKLSIDIGIKNRFKNDPNFFQNLITVPSFKIEFTKMSKSRDKLFKKPKGIDIDIELPRVGKDITLPSLRKVNPRFDFSSFKLGGIDDIFKGSIDGIEKEIRSGIELGLVSSFKLVLTNLLKGLKGGFDLLAPDFGGQNIRDLFDSVDGFDFNSYSNFLIPKFNKKVKLLTDKLNKERDIIVNMPNFGGFPNAQGIIEFPDINLNFPELNVGELNFLPNKYIPNLNADTIELGIKLGILEYPNLEVPDFNISKSDIEKLFDDLSFGLKPREVFELMRGKFDKKEFDKLSGLIKDPKMKLIIDEEMMADIVESGSQFMDQDLIDELESYYDNLEPIGSLCDNLGIPYGLSPYPDVKTLAQELAENYNGLSEEDVQKLTQDLLDKLKDNISDALGKSSNVGLPFDSNPDSFMPSPSDIPAMDFVNDVVLDSIFDPIKREYKREAASFSDNLFISQEKEEYVPMYYKFGEPIVVGHDEDFNLVTELVENDYKYNPEFENYYKSSATPLYQKLENGKYSKYSDDKKPKIKLLTSDPKYGETLFVTKDESDNENIYVKKDTSELVVPEAIRNSISSRLDISFPSNEVNTMILEVNNTKLKYTSENSTLSSNLGESDCIDLGLNLSQQTQNPFMKFENNVKSYIEGIEKGSDYNRNKFDIYSKQIFKGINRVLYNAALKAFENEDLFNSQKLYTMIIDSAEIDMMNFENIKQEIKKDYNNNFSFKDESKDQLTDSTMLGLSKAKFKLYVIEDLMTNCFLYNEFYNPGNIPPTFALKIKSRFESDYSDDPEYVATILENVELSFDKMIGEYYKQIMDSFELIFEQSKKSFLELTNEIEIIRNIDVSENQIPSTVIDAFQNENLNFFLFKYYVDNQGTERALSNNNPRNAELKARLCYVSKLGAFTGIEEVASTLNGIYYKTKDSISLEISDTDNLDSSSTYDLVPIFEFDIENITSDKILMRRTIETLVNEYSVFAEAYELMLIDFSNVVRQNLPNILSSFAATKSAIRDNFKSLKNSKNSFNQDNKELSFKVESVYEEAGTNPEYSNVARKMALQTVPLILKGMAEKFDTNTQIGSGIRKAADLVGVNIPPQIAALMVFGYSNFTIPPNPIGLMYLATGYLEPKERKRIKEMLNGRNTREDIVLASAADIEQQLEQAAEIAIEQAMEMALDKIMSSAKNYLDDIFPISVDYNNHRIFGAEYEVDGQKYYFQVPIHGTARNTEIEIQGLILNLEHLNTNLTSTQDVYIQIENLINYFESLEISYRTFFSDILYGNRIMDSIGGVNVYDDGDLKEIIDQREYRELRKFIKNSLENLYKISGLLNFIGFIVSKISGDEITWNVGNAGDSIKISGDINDFTLSIAEFIDSYTSKWEDSVSSLEGYKNALDYWLRGGTSINDKIKTYIRSSVLPYLKDKGY